ncbi:MAG TPA: alpha/beta fold hydrolase [Acidimicrobiales bacterium]|nr:alpha/beta fold hydrolase [Acidimicrobiales bacterium]
MATTPDGKEIIPGAEPWSAPGGPHGALVIHGFTGNPQSMRGLAEALHGAGYAVELPLLPGHGTSVDDMIETGWGDWSTAAEAAYEDLAARVDRVVVAGLSMGGALALWLAARHPEIAGVVCVNPVVVVGDELVDGIRQTVEGGVDRIPAIGGDLADPAAHEMAYDATPLRPLLSLADVAAETVDELAKIACPVLLMTSPQDHVVDPHNSDVIAAQVSGPVERVTLERSYHVATLDYDKDLILERAIEFAGRATAPG